MEWHSWHWTFYYAEELSSYALIVEGFYEFCIDKEAFMHTIWLFNVGNMNSIHLIHLFRNRKRKEVERNSNGRIQWKMRI